MPNITLSFDDDLLRKGRKHAHRHGKSLNALIRELLAKEIEQKDIKWIDHCFALMDKTFANSKGNRWNREELYEK